MFQRNNGVRNILSFCVFFGALLLVFGFFLFHQNASSGTFFLLAGNNEETPISTKTVELSISSRLIRIGQMNPDEYSSYNQYQEWAASACSTTSMTEVLNAWAGYQKYKIKDILPKEIAVKAISPDLGLLDNDGLSRTMALFGFVSKYLLPDLDTVIQTANAGYPVIVGWPPQKWNGGHLLVVVGGDSKRVRLADSSNYDFTWMTRTTFLKYWGGLAVLSQPKG